ncbi:nucleoporin-interacting protein NIC96 [Ceratobasidium sp. AG-Ba]|nr:nucleoporin-interacting protein NIC96 [Ceratobasidium sp. AG-Ba]QRW05029.1 nucleoporin-interacting protein NIC96 [Ceratobasidium sp. AG-Ba]
MARIIAIASLVASAAAHFTLDWPPTRGFDEDIENRFCGGFNTPGPRSPFPLGAAGINIDSHHDTANLIALISFASNPQNLTQFSNSSDGAQLTNFIRLTKQGEACIPVNIESLGLSNVSNGTNATIQIQFDGGDGNLYQCADVTLVSGATVPSNVTCAGSATSSPSPSASGTAPTSTGSTNAAVGSRAQVGLGAGFAGLLAAVFL